jgi:endoglucanase
VLSEQQLALPNVITNILADEISPQAAVSAMQVGINLGNTLDAPLEGEWALPAEEYYLDAFAEAGFKHVRIPITWHNHIAQQAPYTIDEDFLARVEQIVDWSLSKDLYVIVNAHHDAWIKDDYQNIVNRNRFDTIWLAISERFKDKSAKLIFEILNEPNGMSMADINTLNKRVLSIIRNQTSNRLVIFSGNEWTDIDAFFGAEIPDANDAFLIGNFHSYDPYEFGIICTIDWGSDSDKDKLRAIYQKAADWSVTHNIPVMVNEFGVPKYDFTKPENKCEQPQREAYLKSHVEYANAFGLAATFWDDGGSFSTYDRAGNSWGPEKDILVELQLDKTDD